MNQIKKQVHTTHVSYMTIRHVPLALFVGESRHTEVYFSINYSIPVFGWLIGIPLDYYNPTNHQPTEVLNTAKISLDHMLLSGKSLFSTMTSVSGWWYTYPSEK